MTWSWKEWLSASVITGLILAVIDLGYTLNHRIPDLDAKIDHYSAEQKEWEDKLEAEQRSRLDAMDSQLVAIRTNVLRLCGHTGNLERNCKIDGLVSNTSDIVAIQTRQFAAVRIKQPSGTKPDVDPETEKVLADLRQFPSEPTATGPSQVAAAATWATIAKDSKWFVRDGKLTVSYSNGSAAFVPATGVSQSSVMQAAVNLNKLSETVREAKASVALTSDDAESNTPPQRPQPQPQIDPR